MDVIDKFLDKYSYRFPKGYPDLTDPADKKLMQELLSEIGINEAPETNVFDSRFRPELKRIGLSDVVLDQIKDVFDQKSSGEEGTKYLNSFESSFRQKDISQIKDIFNIFGDYFNIRDKGMGAGEITTLLGVKDSRSGGTADKDILVGDSTYDVKELDANGQFRTASGGYITTSDFKKRFDYLISLLNQLRGSKDSKGTTGNVSADSQIDKLLAYYNSAYKSGGISGGTFKDIKKLCDLLKDLELTRKINKLYVKVGNRKFSVDKETYDKIQGGEVISNVTLGPEISSENSLLTKIKNHPWIENPELVYEDLNIVWDEFLDTIQGLILVDKKSGIPTLYTSDELKKKFAPVRVVQNQINVKMKSSDNIDEDVDNYDEENV
jgi:hypothetical protein